jgi:hypothetical protein
MSLFRDKQFGDKGRKATKVQMESLVPDLSKIIIIIIIKARKVKEVVLIHVWLSGIRALLGTSSYFWPGSSTFIETK